MHGIEALDIREVTEEELYKIKVVANNARHQWLELIQRIANKYSERDLKPNEEALMDVLPTDEELEQLKKLRLIHNEMVNAHEILLNIKNQADVF